MPSPRPAGEKGGKKGCGGLFPGRGYAMMGLRKSGESEGFTMWKKHLSAVDKHRQLILDTMEQIWRNPEPGYREWKTHQYLQEQFEALGYELTLAENVPGFYTVLDTGRPGPEVLVLGELDSLIIPDHPDADKETGAVHACGHHAQCAALLGIAAALKEPGALEGLSGRIRLCAVPAEELIEVDFRQQLKDRGIIRYMGGKTEFLHRGYFDGVDMAMMVHTGSGKRYSTVPGMVGCLSKRVIYRGRSAHAGGCPWDGINALYAAQQGLSAANAIRETFHDEDYIRFHPIITTGGSVANAIPDCVVLESFVRGGSFAAMAEAGKRIDRALIGAALSLGANVDIQDSPGYAPTRQCPALVALAGEAAELAGLPFYHDPVMDTGSTDMGDLSSVMPVLHPYAPGAVGNCHGVDYAIGDAELACVGSAKWQLVMVHLLLENGGKRGREIAAGFTPEFACKEDYFTYIDGLARSGARIRYDGDKAQVQL